MEKAQGSQEGSYILVRYWYLENVGKVSPFQTTITTLSGFVDHYTSVTIITDIVAILLKCYR